MTHIFNLYSKFPPFRRLMWPFIGFGMSALALILILQNNEVSTSPIGWEKNFALTPMRIKAKNVQIAYKGNMIAAVYEGKEKGMAGIYASISFNGGKKFLQPIKIANITSIIEQRPHVAISSNGHIAVVWQSLVSNDPNSRIFYTVSTNMGASWQPPKRLFLPSEVELLPLAFYDDRGVLHIFYNGLKDKAFNLFHITSADEMSFKPPQPLISISERLRGAFFPAILLSGKYIFIAWQGKEEKLGILSDDIFFISSKDYGKSFSSSKRITENKANDASPSMVLSDDILYVAYQNNENKNWSIKLLRGFDRGNLWEKTAITISKTNADCYSPVIVNSNNNEIVTAWHDTGKKKPRIFARKFLISENKLSPIAMLSKNNISARKPVAIAMGRRVVVSWEGDKRIMTKYSDIHVDPPVVYSRTHPTDTWSRLSRAQIEWKHPMDESGIVGYATLVNDQEDFNPNIQNIDGNINSIKIPDLDNGVTYYHIRAIDGAGNYSRTIHYKIQVSRNPLPMPLVESPTHPEGKAVDSRSPILRWTMDETPRLKGFLYSISKGSIKKPDIFTIDFEMNFNDLEEGRYFFNIRSVDKTNFLSRVATYEIIAGKAEELDYDFYGKIAQGFVDEIETQTRITVSPKKKKPPPSVEIEFPFDIGKPHTSSAFMARIKTNNISQKNIIGYSTFVTNKSPMPLDRVNSRDKTINIEDLKSGEYIIGARCRYYRKKNGKRVLYWTKPIIKKFSVSLPIQNPPLVAYMEGISKRVSDHNVWITIPISLVTIILTFVTGVGTKLSFYARLFQLRIGNIIRML